MLSIKDLISGGKIARFKQYRQGTFYYEVEGFTFCVPLADIGDSLLQSEEKASLFMKWIKKALDEANSEIGPNE